MTLKPRHIETSGPEETRITSMREGFHHRIGNIIAKTAEFAVDTSIGAVKIGAYGTARAVRGIMEVADSTKRGLKGQSYHQGA